MTTIEKASEDVSGSYDELRQKCFGDDDKTQPAHLVVEENNLDSSGYSASLGKLVIYLSDGDLMDWDLLRFDGSPPSWRTTLLHEIIHEYQHKRVEEPSEEGKALKEQHTRPFPGHGHDDRFYTAVVAIAPAFGATPEQFLEMI
jgi:hypothetical protein